MHNTLLRVDRFLEARWVTEGTTKYDTKKYRRVTYAFIRHIINSLVEHYAPWDATLHQAAITLQRSNRFNDTDGHVVLRKTQHYTNPTIDTICYLSDVYENITPTTTENDERIEAAALIETDLLEDCINGFGDETRYPWSWTRISSELYTPPVMPRVVRRSNTGL